MGMFQKYEDEFVYGLLCVPRPEMYARAFQKKYNPQRRKINYLFCDTFLQQ